MKKIKSWIRNHFSFSQRETNGFVVLVILLMVVLLITPVLRIVFPEPVFTSLKDQRLLDSVLAAWEKDTSKRHRHDKITHQFSSEISPFNPNEATLVELERIVGKKMARTIVNFRNKGGRFIVKSDLQKIYGMDEKMYQQLEAYIILPDGNKSEIKSISSKVYPKVKLSLDINRASSDDLLAIHGIGPVLSTRIIKYRDKLGGFISKDQIKEVYGLDSSVVDLLKESIFIESTFSPAKISVNDASWQVLSGHPYIGNKYAIAIIRYREQQGKYKELSQLYLIKSIPANAIDRFLSYVKVE